MDKLKVAILIVSDTASQDPASDRTANALAPILAAEDKWETPAVRIVPDNVFEIQRAVCEWSDDSVNWYNLILLSGGTGFAIKDNTPEVSLFFLSRSIHLYFALFVYLHMPVSFNIKAHPVLMTSQGRFSPDTSSCSWLSVSLSWRFSWRSHGVSKVDAKA
ncbi:hypothetical protein VI817_000938 [Penicillium citrinum]|nr:hypothetical protein VI817_000938 [Penicillium citrinum]